MALPSTNNPAPVSEEAFIADRMQFWSSFTGATTGLVIVVIVLLAAMAIFLV
jgi:hypothetical protein